MDKGTYVLVVLMQAVAQEKPNQPSIAYTPTIMVLVLSNFPLVNILANSVLDLGT